MFRDIGRICGRYDVSSGVLSIRFNSKTQFSEIGFGAAQPETGQLCRLIDANNQNACGKGVECSRMPYLLELKQLLDSGDYLG